MAPLIPTKDSYLYSTFRNMMDAITSESVTYSGDDRKVIIAVEDMIDKAGAHGGKVFGGYVRDIVMSALSNEGRYLGGNFFKDVDIWFQSEAAAQAFVTDCGLRLNPDELFNAERFGRYAFDTSQYILDIVGKETESTPPLLCPIFVDVVVSETVPVNDFTCNLLLYGPYTGEYAPSFDFQIGDDKSYRRSFWSACPGDYSADDLVQDMKIQGTIMLPTFASGDDGQLSPHNHLRWRKFRDHYRIQYPRSILDKFPEIRQVANTSE